MAGAENRFKLHVLNDLVGQNKILARFSNPTLRRDSSAHPALIGYNSSLWMMQYHVLTACGSCRIWDDNNNTKLQGCDVTE